MSSKDCRCCKHAVTYEVDAVSFFLFVCLFTGKGYILKLVIAEDLFTCSSAVTD